MQIEIKIDDSCTEPKVIILTDKVTDEINDILNTLSSKTPEVITGFYNALAEILSPEDIIRIYAEGGKTFASVNKKEYNLRQRLYELEDLLTKHNFVRISNSEIINLKKVIYIAIFFFIYFSIWIGRYFTMKKKIQAINDKIKSDSVNKK